MHVGKHRLGPIFELASFPEAPNPEPLSSLITHVLACTSSDPSFVRRALNVKLQYTLRNTGKLKFTQV